MPSPKKYDILVLGSGGGGKLLAWTLAKKGLKVAVIEREYIGGSCPNVACLPSKNVIQSAKVASYFQRSEEFGITKENTKIDMVAVRARKRKMVSGLIDIHFDLFKKSGAELILGSGHFVGPKTIEVTLSSGEKELLQGDKIVISTGSRTTTEHIPGLSEAKPLTHVDALELDHIPKHLLVLGGGYVGLEFAQAMRRFGSQVTILEQNKSLVHHEDDDVTQALLEICSAEGIKVVTGITIDKVEGRSGESVKLHGVKEGSSLTFEGTDLLITNGRVPNTDGIGLDLVGVQTTDDGYVRVNEFLETNIPDVFAAGDCAGSPKFTHIAHNDSNIIADRITGGHRTTRGRLVPYCLFIDPELARIGLSEKEAKAKKIPYRLAKMPMVFDLRAITLSETTGFMKALIDPKNDLILGFTALGVSAGEILGAIQIAMVGKVPYPVLKDIIFTHPTLLEGLGGLFSNVSSEVSS